jgi:hypothetical protein
MLVTLQLSWWRGNCIDFVSDTYPLCIPQQGFGSMALKRSKQQMSLQNVSGFNIHSARNICAMLWQSFGLLVCPS